MKQKYLAQYENPMILKNRITKSQSRQTLVLDKVDKVKQQKIEAIQFPNTERIRKISINEMNQEKTQENSIDKLNKKVQKGILDFNTQQFFQEIFGNKKKIQKQQQNVQQVKNKVQINQPDNFKRHFMPDTLLNLQIHDSHIKYKNRKNESNIQICNHQFRDEILDHNKKPFIISLQKDNKSFNKINQIQNLEISRNMDRQLQRQQNLNKSQIIDDQIKQIFNIFNSSVRIQNKSKDVVPKPLFS